MHIDTIREQSEVKFFIPKVSDAEHCYSLMREGLKKLHGVVASERRVYSIKFTFKGREIEETIGLPSPSNDEVVWAILEGGNIFYTYTANSPQPMLISNVEKVTYFSD